MDPSGTKTENNEATVSDEYNDDKAKENLINAIREHVLPDLGDEGRKKVESIIEKIKDGSFDEVIYKNAGRPKTGTDVSPTKFEHLIKDKDLRDFYYIARARDYQIRNANQIKNGENDVAQYYIEYGAKYMFKFKYEKRNDLSDKGKEWLDETLVNLQEGMEQIVSEHYESELLEKDNPESLYKRAFASHVLAYVSAGFCSLEIGDKITIGNTPDKPDLWEGREQALSVIKECYVDSYAREIKGMYDNFLQDAISRQVKTQLRMFGR